MALLWDERHHYQLHNRFGALLALAAHVLVLRRLAATVEVTNGGRSHLGLIASIPLFVAAGTLVLLATSQGVLWDLHQTGWDLPRYVLVVWDRLTMHAIALAALCVVIVLVFLVRPRRVPAFLILGLVPVLATLFAGYLLYR